MPILLNYPFSLIFYLEASDIINFYLGRLSDLEIAGLSTYLPHLRFCLKFKNSKKILTYSKVFLV